VDQRPDLVVHLAHFVRGLRELGLSVGLSDEVDALRALTLIDIGDRDEVRRALRSALKIRNRDLATIDILFARMWGGHSGARASRVIHAESAVVRGVSGASASLPAERELPTGDEPGYSPAALLRHKRFEECTPADLAAMERLMRRLVKRIATRPSRRRVPTHGRGEIDLRRSFRRSVSHGGELLSPAHRQRARERPRLVVLADTSGSMDPHTRFLLPFIRALRRVAKESKVFVFNTALTRLRTLEHLDASVPDWSGGTRIGECLAEFVANHLEATVDTRTVVLILSDGLDRGDVAPVAEAMKALQRRAHRVVWLNPFAGDERYEPTARAMAAALPYIDRLLPAHDLASLEQILWAFR